VRAQGRPIERPDASGTFGQVSHALFPIDRGNRVQSWIPRRSPVNPPAGEVEDGSWSLLSGPLDPPQTADARAVHDPLRHRLVLVNGDNFHELWEMTLP